MAFIDGEEKTLQSRSTEALLERLKNPISSLEDRVIRSILENRGVLAPILNPFELSIDYNRFAKPLLDQATRFMSCIDPAKDDTELKINVKRRNIKFNFNN